jgi:Lysophospholipase
MALPRCARRCRFTAREAFRLALILALAAIAAGAEAQRAAGPFLYGRWEGVADLGSGDEPMVLRLFPADSGARAAEGGLLDLPSRELYGYPIDSLAHGVEGLVIDLGEGSPLGGKLELVGLPATPEEGSALTIAGSSRIVPTPPLPAGAAGRFRLRYSADWSYGADRAVKTPKGNIPGSLVLPAPSEAESAGGESYPLALLVSSSGADRDGDNPSVPGKSDALALLAAALRDRGVASWRYDARGTGAAYRLASTDAEPTLGERADDLARALRDLGSDSRYDRLVVVGHAEGILVAAAALSRLAPREVEALRLGGLAALCSSGASELELVRSYIEGGPDEEKAQGEAIIEALLAGKGYPEPDEYYADYFRPGVQAYLSSIYRFDLESSLASAPCPLLVVAGSSDMQVIEDEALLLASYRADADYRLVPGMSHTLKDVGEDEEANFNSFVDPSLPISPRLAQLLADFAKGSLARDEPAAQASPAPDARALEPEAPRGEGSSQGGDQAEDVGPR